MFPGQEDAVSFNIGLNKKAIENSLNYKNSLKYNYIPVKSYSPWGCKRVGHDLTIEQQRKIIITDKTVNSQKVKKISYMNTLRGKL